MANVKTALLLSGGMDSTAIAFWKRPDILVTMDYGQVPAAAEIRASAAVAADLDIEHRVLRLPSLRVLGSGDLSGRDPIAIAPSTEWWPYRNQLLITLAAGALACSNVSRLLVGTLASDGHHSDGTPAFVAALNALLSLQEGGMRLEAPAIAMDAVELVRRSGVPMSILAWSHSCHRANYACGECGGCRKHYRTMEALGDRPY